MFWIVISAGKIEYRPPKVSFAFDFLQRIGEHTIFDPSRSERKGIPEIVYGQTKSAEVLAEIAKRDHGGKGRSFDIEGR